jgi:hypothetical protein
VTSDLDILRSAKLWLDRHGDAAVKEARRRAAELQVAGERDGADIWLRIIVAIQALTTSSTKAH